MSTAKFEKLIALLINEDHERADQLFHEIVVEKSREIYESIMEEDMTSGLMDEIECEEEGMEGVMEDDEEFMDAEIEDDNIDGEEVVDADEEFSDGEDEMTGEEEFEVGTDDSVTKDDIMNLEDKLDQLMAEFEAEFGEGDAEEEADEAEEEATDAEIDADEAEDEVMESVQLKKVQAVKGGDNGAQSKSPVVANAGAKGPVGSVVKPVTFSGDTESVPTSAKGPSNAYSKGQTTVGDKFQNSPAGASGTKGGKGEAAPKPKTETIKAKSPVAEGRTAKRRI